MSKGYQTLGDILELTEEELLSFKNIGLLTATEILDFIHDVASQGLSTDHDVEESNTSTDQVNLAEQDYFSEIISRARLPKRALRILSELNISSLDELAHLSPDTIINYPTAGKTTLSQLAPVIPQAKAYFEVYERSQYFFDRTGRKRKNCLLAELNVDSDQVSSLTALGILSLKNLEHELFEYTNEYSEQDKNIISLLSKNSAVQDLLNTEFESNYLEFQANRLAEQFAPLEECHVGELLEFIGSSIAEFCNGEDFYDTFSLASMLVNSDTALNRIRKYISSQWPFGVEPLDLSSKIFHSTNSFSQEIIEKILNRLIAKGEIVSSGKEFFLKCPSIDQFIAELATRSVRDANIIRMRLEGKTLEEVGLIYGITRERVRQIEKNALLSLSGAFSEGFYSYFFRTYSVSRSAFLLICDDEKTFNYLKLRYTAGSKSLESAIDDPKVADSIKQQISKKRFWASQKQKNQLIEEIVISVLKQYCSADTPYYLFYEYYQKELLSLELDPSRYRLKLENFRNHWSQKIFLFWKQNSLVRHYDYEKYNLDDFINSINFKKYLNQEISSETIFQDYLQLMKQFDIRDKYELHSILRKLLISPAFPIRFGRMPTLTIGEPNEENQVISVLRDLKSATSMEIAHKYRELYGVAENSFIANKLFYLEPYKNGSRYEIEPFIDEFTDEECLAISRLLTKGFYTIDQIQNKFKETLHSDKQIPARLFSKFGYSMKSEYIISKKCKSVVSYFREEFFQLGTFNLDKFEEYRRYSFFNNTLHKLKKNFDIFDMGENNYITIKVLEKDGLSKNDIANLCKKIYNSVADDAYFTVPQILPFISNHKLVTNYSLPLLKAILRNASFPFKFIKFGQDLLFHKGHRIINPLDFIISLISPSQSISTDEFLLKLKDVYKISSDLKVLEKYFDSERLYYHQTRGVIFLNYADYYKSLAAEHSLELLQTGF